MTRKAMQAHLDAIRAGAITSTNLIGLRKAFNACERKQRYPWASLSHQQTAIDPADVARAETMLAIHKPRATAKLHDSGVERLTAPRYRSRWNATERAIIDSIDRFELLGFDCDLYRVAVPIWRVIGRNGDSFCFINPSWQSGGNGPERY